jgi:hypothetical protein
VPSESFYNGNGAFFSPANPADPTSTSSSRLSTQPETSTGRVVPTQVVAAPYNHSSFKHRQDWYFKADPSKVFDPAGPQPSDIIILTAGDGKGNNGEIPDLLQRVSQNRQDFCDYHGYTCVFTNITKYDLEGHHPVRFQLRSHIFS